MRKTNFLILLFLAAAIPALAVQAPFVTGTGEEASFRGFEDDAGGFYLVWVQGGQEKSASLKAQHISPQGQSLWDAEGLLVSSHLSSVQDWSGLADGQGGLTLFWDESDGVHAQRFSPDGSRQRPGTSVRMSTSTAIQPDAVPDAEGGTLLVWREFLPMGRSVLKAQRLLPDGERVWPRGGIRVSLRASDQTNPRIVYDNMSGMIVAWRDEGNSASELRVQRIDFGGNRLWGLEGLKVTAPVGVTEFPRMAPLKSGEAVLAWTGQVKQTNQIFLQKVGPKPALQWEAKTLASAVPILYNRWNAVLRGDDIGGTWIAWEDFSNQLNYQIRINHLDGDGKSFWPAGDIAPGPADGDQGLAAMTHDGKDGVWVAWIDNRHATVGLYLQQVDSAGRRIQGTKGRLIADQLTKPSTPQLVSLGIGKSSVIWADRPKKNAWSLFWSIVGAPQPKQ